MQGWWPRSAWTNLRRSNDTNCDWRARLDIFVCWEAWTTYSLLNPRLIVTCTRVCQPRHTTNIHVGHRVANSYNWCLVKTPSCSTSYDSCQSWKVQECPYWHEIHQWLLLRSISHHTAHIYRGSGLVGSSKTVGLICKHHTTRTCDTCTHNFA